MPKRTILNKNSFFYPFFFQISTLVCLLLTPTAFALPEPEWNTWYDKGDISISYLKDNTGDITIKASVMTKSTLSAFILFLQDTDHIPKWLDNANKSTVIEQISKNENVFITHFDGFWPVKPRNMVIQTQYVQASDMSIRITSVDAGQQYPQISNSIRVKVNYANWQIKPLNDNQSILIQYQLSVNPNLSLPNTFVRSLTLNSMKETLSNIQQQLPKSNWQDFELDGINDPPFNKVK